MGSEKVGLLKQLAKALMTDYIPYHQVDLMSIMRIAKRYDHFLFGDLGSNCADVFIIEIIENEPFDQTGLSDTTLPDQAELQFDGFFLSH
jgi:hypothetical protein